MQTIVNIYQSESQRVRDAIDKVMSKSKEDEMFKTEAGVMFG